jgi:hypothetical protein
MTKSPSQFPRSCKGSRRVDKRTARREPDAADLRGVGDDRVRPQRTSLGMRAKERTATSARSTGTRSCYVCTTKASMTTVEPVDAAFLKPRTVIVMV